MDLLVNAETESGVVDDIDRKEMYGILKDYYEFNSLEFFSDTKNYTKKDISFFNGMIKDLKFVYRYDLIDCINILSTDFISKDKIKDVLSILDDECTEILKKELSKKYHIKQLKTKLFQFLR